MTSWTLKKRWYSAQQWMFRRVIGVLLVLLMGFGPGFPFSAFAATDDFVGDSAIYMGAPTERVRPKVLFLIDNSRATLNPASGSQYYPSVLYNVTVAKPAWNIYQAKNTGEFSLVALSNSTPNLEQLNSGSDLASGQCPSIVSEKLQGVGTYTSSGASTAPNITNFGNCGESVIGAVYAIGNYLNYLESDPWNASQACFDDDMDDVCDEDDVCRGFPDDFSVKAYSEIETIYAELGMTVPDTFISGVGVKLYDMDGDGVPNGLPGTPWADGCDACLAGDDSLDEEFDSVPDDCGICSLPVR